MAYSSKIRALDAICRALGGAGGHVRVVRALNEWCRLAGGTGGHVRNLPALNEICGRLGAEAEHGQELHALNAIARQLGGTGGHRVNLAALAEIAARLGADGAGSEWAPAPVRLFGAGDSRLADGRQGAAPYDSGYVLHRYSALNVAVWALCGKVEHDARRDLFATPGCTLAQWIDLHLADLLAAVGRATNPVVLVHLGTHSLPGASLAEMQAQAASIITALTGRGARVCWLLESPRTGGSVLSPANETKRRAYNAWLAARTDPRFQTIDYLPGYTSDGTTDGATARVGLQRDNLHDTQAGAWVKAAATLPVLRALPPVAAAAGFTAAAPAFHATTNPGGNRLSPLDWVGEVRNAGDTEPGTSLTSTFSTETIAGRSWQTMRLGGTGGGGEQVRLYQAPYADGYRGGDTIRYRVRVAWEGLVNVRAVKVILFHYGAGFFGINTGPPEPATRRAVPGRRCSRAAWC